MRRRRFGWLWLFGRPGSHAILRGRARPLTWAELAYGLLVWLYPPSLRRAYGSDMLQAFRDTMRDERRQHGWRGALRAWAITLGDVAVSLPREWRRGLGRGWRGAWTGGARRSGIRRRVRLPGGGWRVEGWIGREPGGAALHPTPVFGARAGPETARRATMQDRFDKFTERARKVMSLAQEEAQRFNHNYIGTEHILLGLVAEGEGLGAKALINLGVELGRARTALEFIIGRGDRIVLGAVGMTPRAKKVIELAVDEARRLGHHYVGTEHLLLGLIREGEGIAAGVLESLGVNLERARSSVLEMVMGQSGAAPATEAPAFRASLGLGMGIGSGPAISVITLVCRDVEATQAFYVDYISAVPVPQAAPGASALLRIRTIGPMIGLRAADPASAAVTPTGVGAMELNFSVRDAGALLNLWSDLRQRGAPDLSEIGDVPGSPRTRAFTLTDPDGRALRFYGKV
jgi:ClpA/ClpB-like protein